jgi:DUF4097 and DUF4098 domain-containing protein YvlB
LHKSITKSLFAIALALGLSLSAAAQQKEVRVYRDGATWVEETTGSIPAAKGFSLQSDIGSVHVQGAKQSTITYTIKKRVSRSQEDLSRRDMENFVINVSRHADVVMVEANWPRQRSGRLDVEYYIKVPAETAAVKVETLGGGVDIKAIAGKAYAQTAGGSISLDDIGSNAGANTMGGKIEIGHVGGDVKLENAGGDIRIGTVNGIINASTSGGNIQIGSGRGAITVESAGGSINVANCGGQLRATTAGGSIDIGDVGEGARLETAGGGIRLASAHGNVSANTLSGGIRLKKLTRGVNAETASGPIEAEFIARSGEFSDSRLETTAGDIVVYLPSDLAATVKASIELANGHNIFSDFDGIKVSKEGGDFGPREVWADGRINSGGPVLKLHTTNGNIYIHKVSAKR